MEKSKRGTPAIFAVDEEIIRRHAELSGFPATKITEIHKMIDPTTEQG